MKIKTIKKFNALFVVLLFVAGGFAGGIFLWSTWENEELNASLLAGKAALVDVSKKELGAEKEEQQTNNLVDEEEVILAEDKNVVSKEVDDEQVTEELEIAKDVSFSFVVIGDSESYKQVSGFNKELEEVLKSAQGYNPDFALFTGDIISASESSLEKNRSNMVAAKNVIESYFDKYYISFGNHDVECGKECAHSWQEVLFNFTPESSAEDKLYYSFDYENTHFVLLSTDYPLKHSVDRAQLAWLEKDLETNSRENTIVLQHVSPVAFFEESSEECHDMSCDPRVKERLFELYKKYDVDCVVSGHEHAFDHKVVDGIDYVISGNTGNESRYEGATRGDIFSYFIIDNEEIVLKAVNTKGKLLKEIKVK